MIFSLPTFLNLRFEPNRMDLVLSSPKWMLSLLSSNHSHRLLKSLFKCFSILVTCQSNFLELLSRNVNKISSVIYEIYTLGDLNINLIYLNYPYIFGKKYR